MSKLIFIFYLLTLGYLNAKVLVMGDSTNQYMCDNVPKYPIGVEDCKQIEAHGDIVICYFKNTDIGCKKLFKGDFYELGNTDKNSLSFERLLSFSNNTKVSFGVKRFGNDIKETGMPVGSLLKPDEDIKVLLDKNYMIKLVILDNDKVVLKYSSEDSIIVIPKNIFQYNKNFDWQIYLDGVLYKGSFDILEQSIHNEIEQEFNDLSKDITDRKTKLYIKSILYDQYGLIYNRNEILNGAN